jgi:AcrR family transcriptional regulator
MLVERKVPGRKATTPRNPQRTRELLLQAASRKVYRSGFQGTDLDTILDAAGVTKGALYHHFDSKEALGYAVVDEVLAGITRDKWLLPLEKAGDPIEALVRIVQSTSLKSEDVRGGCPVNNLVQEMSPLDEGFRKRLAKVFDDWRRGIAGALRRGQKTGVVAREVDPVEAANFVMATYEGYISLAKASLDPRLLRAGMKRIVRYLESLRVAEG